MKRIIAIILLFFLVAATAWAAIPLAPLAAAAIGASLMSVLGATGSGTKVSLNPTGSYSYDGPNLLVPCAVYNNYMQAGTSIALGYLSSIPFDVQGAWDAGLFQASPTFDSIIDQTFPSTPPNNLDGVKIECLAANASLCGSSNVAKLTIFQDDVVGGFTTQAGINSYIETTPPRFYSPPSFLKYQVHNQPHQIGPYWYCHRLTYSVQYIPGTPDVYGAPEHLTNDQAAALGASFAAAAGADPDIRNGLDDVVKAAPGLVQSPPAISPADVKAWASAAGAAAANDRIAEAAANAAAHPDEPALANELAKAIADAAQRAADEVAEQAEKEAETETFPPLSPSGFAEPYNPGEYDIPGRFTTFLDRVKSTGLFSFSSSFFNSLPGGGSPVYEINGGQTFGHHTIDLSQTMSTGLAVLKTILLACFGFLSIRAVIMKR